MTWTRASAVSSPCFSGSPSVAARLYVLTGSHPCIAAELMLRHKGLAYRLVELPVVLSRVILRAMRFPRKTVPAMRLGNRLVQGSLAISWALEELRPDPPLFPPEPGARERVEEAERWGEELQDAARRIELWGLGRDRAGVEVQLRASSFPIPPRLGARLAGPLLWQYRRITGATEDAVRRDLAALPAMLDRVDRLIEDGVIGAEEPNAASFQIAPSVRLLMTMDDLRPVIDSRPAGSLAARLVPTYSSRLAAGVLPGA
jgi:glutathione S-transferase